MVVGPKVRKKFTWLMDEVEVKGIVREFSNDEANKGDTFGLEPDDNYKHLISLFPGNNPLHWNKRGFPGCIHCETYPDINTTQRGGINKEPYPSWLKRDGTPLDTKPVEPFTIIDPNTGERRDLKVGDHIRVVGRWVLDHHPEYCDGGGKVVPCDQPHDYTTIGGGAPRRIVCWRYSYASGYRCRVLGLLRVGFPHAELHPFRWHEITLVTDKKPNDVESEILSLAAPLYEEVYVWGGKWAANAIAGVASYAPEIVGQENDWTSIYITEDGSNFHNSVTANAYIKAPALPQGFTPHISLIGYHEQILKNGTGLDISSIRTITVVNDGIKVASTVTAPKTERYILSSERVLGGIFVGNIHDPANDKSIFQAQYWVRWLPRLVALDSNENPIEKVELPPTPLDSTSKFGLLIKNRGPDKLTINRIHQGNNPSSQFKIDNLATIPRDLPRNGGLDMVVNFSPMTLGNPGGTLFVETNDPAHWQFKIPLSAKVLPPVSSSGYKDGNLLKEQNDPKVFVIYGGAKFWIPNPAVFQSLGFSSDDIRTIPDGSLAAIPNIPVDRTLLKEQNNPSVYFMQGGRRRLITSPESFNAYRFSWDNVRTVPDGSLSAVPQGDPLPYPPRRIL